jgi:hypothetical protein
MKPSLFSAVLNLLFLSLLTACLAVPIRARADEFVHVLWNSFAK